MDRDVGGVFVQLPLLKGSSNDRGGKKNGGEDSRKHVEMIEELSGTTKREREAEKVMYWSTGTVRPHTVMPRLGP